MHNTDYYFMQKHRSYIVMRVGIQEQSGSVAMMGYNRFSLIVRTFTFVNDLQINLNQEQSGSEEMMGCNRYQKVWPISATKFAKNPVTPKKSSLCCTNSA